jgi:hypothetical protein
MGGIVSSIGDALGSVGNAVGSIVSNPIVDTVGLGLATGGIGNIASGAADAAGAAGAVGGDTLTNFGFGGAIDPGTASISSMLDPTSSGFAGLVPDAVGGGGSGTGLSSFLSPSNLLTASQLGGSALGAYSANKAAQVQAAAAQAALNQQQSMFNTINSQQAPWRQAGATAVQQLSGGLAPGGQFNKVFSPSDLQTNLAPNYQFQLQQGLGAINNSATIGSGLVGGNTLKAINDYAQNYAGDAYQNAFNNFNASQTNIFNRLASLAQLGQTSANQVANSALGFGTNIGNALVGQGQAQAAGAIGMANAINGGLNNAAGINYLSSFLNPSMST